MRDRQLWNHIKPHFIVAGDAIYHFGHTEFARTFRKDLKARLRETETFFVYPELFDSIVQRECAEFSDRLIPVPKGSAQKVNIDLTQNFELPGLHNVLGLLFLPLGCTMSRHVYLWGFDGRAPGDKLFWSNSRKHSYPELIPELQKAHPRFFDHFIPKDDSNKYIKLAFGNLLENCLTAAESEGWQFVMMHHSWTPTLAKRCIKEITSLDKEKLLTHQKGNTSDSDFSAIFGEHKICPNPFLALEIHTDGNVSICCTAHLNKGCEFVGNILYEPLDEIWNSDKIQLFREVMYTAQYGKTCKPFCPQLIALKKGQTPLWYSHLCDAETFGEIAGKKIVLNSPYRAVSVASDGSCNLHCIMCRNDKKLRPTELEKLVNQKLYSQILDNISKIRFLELTGTGEPFFNKSVSDFIEQLKNKDTHNLVIRFITNGQLLTEERWQQIEALNAKELRISVSIDAASKEIYESIRRGAKWEMLLRNMKMLSEKRAKGKLDRLETSLCVMKRNIHEMVPFIELCRAWNCDKIELKRIFGTIAGDENIFDNEDTSCLETLSAVLQDPRFDEKWIAASSLLPYRNYSAERNILPETPVGQMESGLTVASNALMQPGRLSKEFSERACDKVS